MDVGGVGKAQGPLEAGQFQVGVDEARGDGQGAPVLRHGAQASSPGRLELAEGEEGFRVAGGGGEHPAKVFFGLPGVAHEGLGAGQVFSRRMVARGLGQDQAEGRGGLRIALAPQLHQPPAVEQGQPGRVLVEGGGEAVADDRKGLVVLAQVVEHVGQHGQGRDVFGIDGKGGQQQGFGLAREQLAGLDQGQVDVAAGEGRVVADGGFDGFLGLVHVSLAPEHHGQIVEGQGRSRGEGQVFPVELLAPFAVLPAAFDVGQVVEGHGVVFVDGQPVGVELLLRGPMPQVFEADEHGGKDRRPGQHRRQKPAQAEAAEAVRGQPDAGHEQADGGYVGVAVGQGLAADLDDADDRDQGAEKPQPAREQVGLFCPGAQAQAGDRRQGQDAAGHPPGRQMGAHGIEEGQRPGPDHAPQVEHVGVGGVGQPRGQGQGVEAGHGAAVALGQEGQEAGGGHEQEHGQFFEEKPPKAEARAGPVRARGGRAPFPAAQGPDIEEQHGAWRRDQHGFGHKPQGQPEKDQGKAARARFPGMADVGVEREQEKKRAEDVLDLGYPGHGFDMEGVDGEQRGDHEAFPGRAGRPPQEGVQQEHVGHVQGQIDDVVAARVEAEDVELDVEGEPGEGVPVGLGEFGQAPPQGLEGNRILDGVVADDVADIVPGEAEIGHGPVVDDGYGEKEQAAAEDGVGPGQGRDSIGHWHGWAKWLLREEMRGGAARLPLVAQHGGKGMVCQKRGQSAGGGA